MRLLQQPKKTLCVARCKRAEFARKKKDVGQPGAIAQKKKGERKMAAPRGRAEGGNLGTPSTGQHNERGRVGGGLFEAAAWLEKTGARGRRKGSWKTGGKAVFTSAGLQKGREATGRRDEQESPLMSSEGPRGRKDGCFHR